MATPNIEQLPIEWFHRNEALLEKIHEQQNIDMYFTNKTWFRVFRMSESLNDTLEDVYDS